MTENELLNDPGFRALLLPLDGFGWRDQLPILADFLRDRDFWHEADAALWIADRGLYPFWASSPDTPEPYANTCWWWSPGEPRDTSQDPTHNHVPEQVFAGLRFGRTDKRCWSRYMYVGVERRVVAFVDLIFAGAAFLAAGHVLPEDW